MPNKQSQKSFQEPRKKKLAIVAAARKVIRPVQIMNNKKMT